MGAKHPSKELGVAQDSEAETGGFWGLVGQPHLLRRGAAKSVRDTVSKNKAAIEGDV